MEKIRRVEDNKLEYIVLSVVFILAIGFSYCLAIGMTDLTQDELKKFLEEKHKHENID